MQRRVGLTACVSVAVIASLAVTQVGGAQIAPPRPAGSRDSYWSVRLARPEPDVRAGALRFLGRYAPAGVAWTEPLRQFAEHEHDRNVLLALVNMLAGGRQPGSASVLRAMVEAPVRFPDVHAAAARALAQTDEGGLGVLLLSSPMVFASPDVQDAVAQALALLPDAEIGRALDLARLQTSRMPVFLRAIGERGDPRWSLLIQEQLRASTAATVRAAVRAAARLRLVELAVDVADVARDSADRMLRSDAIEALGALGGPPDLAVLMAAVDEPATRRAAIRAMGTLGDARYISGLAPHLSARWSVDRLAAAEALGHLFDPASIALLAERVTSEPDAIVRAAILRSLWAVAPSRARAFTERRLATDAAARRVLAERIEVHRETPLHYAAIESLAPLVRRGDPTSLRLLASSSPSSPTLLAALRDADARRRLDAALAIGAWHSPADAVLRGLTAQLVDEPDPSVRAAVAMALGQMDDDIARDALRGLLDAEADGPSRAAMVAAVAMGRWRVRAAVPSLRRLMYSALGLVRRVAIDALGRVGDAAGGGEVERTIESDPDGDVGATALVAFARLRDTAAIPRLELALRAAPSPRSVALCQRALALARHDAVDSNFAAPEGVHGEGADPGSVWASWRSDGSTAFAIADSEGSWFAADVSEIEPAAFERIDAP